MESKVKNKAVNSALSKKRKTLKSLLGTGAAASAVSALPASWTKPVINSVFLPGHAELSVIQLDCRESILRLDIPGTYFVQVPNGVTAINAVAGGGRGGNGGAGGDGGNVTAFNGGEGAINGDPPNNGLTSAVECATVNEGEVLTVVVGAVGGPQTR